MVSVGSRTAEQSLFKHEMFVFILQNSLDQYVSGSWGSTAGILIQVTVCQFDSSGMLLLAMQMPVLGHGQVVAVATGGIMQVSTQHTGT